MVAVLPQKNPSRLPLSQQRKLKQESHLSDCSEGSRSSQANSGSAGSGSSCSGSRRNHRRLLQLCCRKRLRQDDGVKPVHGDPVPAMPQRLHDEDCLLQSRVRLLRSWDITCTVTLTLAGGSSLLEGPCTQVLAANESTGMPCAACGISFGCSGAWDTFLASQLRAVPTARQVEHLTSHTTDESAHIAMSGAAPATLKVIALTQ